MTPNLIIRKVEFEDLPTLSETAIRSYKDHFLHLWEDGGENYMNRSFEIKNLTEDWSNPNHEYYLAFWENQPVGYLKLRINSPLEGCENLNALELERIYLIKEAQGKKNGKSLIINTLDIAKENQKELVWLRVMDTNTASLEFYKRMGFEICGTDILNAPFVKKGFEGMLVMKKVLLSRTPDP